MLSIEPITMTISTSLERENEEDHKEDAEMKLQEEEINVAEMEFGSSTPVTKERATATEVATSQEEEESLLRNSLFGVMTGIGADDNDSEDFPVDLTSFAIVKATNPMNSNRSIIYSITPLVFAYLFTWVKILILANILVDSIYIRCTEHDQCNDGTVCIPVNFIFPDRPIDNNNAGCTDCNSLPFLAQRFEAGHPQEQLVLDGIEYCAEDDPDICEFIESNRARMSLLTIVLLFLIAASFSKLVEFDLRKSLKQHKLLDKRLTLYENQFHVKMIRIVGWFMSITLAYLTPSWMTIAAANLIVSYPPEARSLIIVPLEIGLIAEFDTVVNYLFVGGHQSRIIQDAAEILDEPPTNEQNKKETWITEEMVESFVVRLYGYLLAITAVIFALNPTEVYPKLKFMHAFIGYAPRFSVVSPCDAVIVGAMFLPLIVVGPFAAFLESGNAIYLWAKSNITARILMCLKVPATFLLIIYSWVLIFWLLAFLQYVPL